MNMDVLKNLRSAMAVILAVQVGVILFQYACCYAIHVLGGKLYQVLHNYFKPDYETALLKGYIRPIIGLVLCEKCTALRSWRKRSRVRHSDGLPELEASATEGCWLCRSIRMGISQSEADRENPPALDRPEQLPSHSLLLWFAERTETGDGFLDHLRGKSYIAYIYGQHAREIAPDPSSEASFDLVKEWVGKCDMNHSCYQGDQTPLPTRVLDVHTGTPFLYISDGRKASYMTLSHCWGGEQPLITTTSTLEEHCRGIPMESFPELYRDAVEVTRRLGIQYLWIDSLCILQDCKDDWSKEAARMGDIYRHSYLTLYALSSPNCHHGMLVPRDGASAAAHGIINTNNSNYHERTRESVFQTAPLCKRAWALQERLLSPRLLYYSDGEMFWECLAHTAREGNHRIVLRKATPYRYESFECPQVRDPLVRPLDDNPSFPVSPPSDWQIIVSEYSRCRLTYRSDKLPALSGLASMFQRNTGYTYAAGMWIENLGYELLWYCPIEQDSQKQDFGSDNSAFSKPSWSWISTDFAVRFKALGNMRDASFQFIQMEGADPAPKENIDPTYMLTIKCEWYSVSVQSQSGSRRCMILDGNGRESLASGILDASDEPSSGPRSGAAILLRERMGRDMLYEAFDTSRHMTYLLVIVPAPQTAGGECWRRIGLAWTAQDLVLARIAFIVIVVASTLMGAQWLGFRP